ncbi:hypothetical protein [Streptomyces sp. OE57]|uniref:hypothetical protein n=1 Tax=Streptomyces lacaronensis TaxID=3379885 RepID=UPI0039B795D6
MFTQRVLRTQLTSRIGVARTRHDTEAPDAQPLTAERMAEFAAEAPVDLRSVEGRLPGLEAVLDSILSRVGARPVPAKRVLPESHFWRLHDPVPHPGRRIDADWAKMSE